MWLSAQINDVIRGIFYCSIGTKRCPFLEKQQHKMMNCAVNRSSEPLLVKVAPVSGKTAVILVDEEE